MHKVTKKIKLSWLQKQLLKWFDKAYIIEQRKVAGRVDFTSYCYLRFSLNGARRQFRICVIVDITGRYKGWKSRIVEFDREKHAEN